jgi:hypothetical protein
MKMKIHMSMKKGCLFVLFIYLFIHIDISQTMLPLVAFLVPLESPQWVRVQQVGSIMF